MIPESTIVGTDAPDSTLQLTMAEFVKDPELKTILPFTFIIPEFTKIAVPLSVKLPLMVVMAFTAEFNVKPESITVLEFEIKIDLLKIAPPLMLNDFGFNTPTLQTVPPFIVSVPSKTPNVSIQNVSPAFTVYADVSLPEMLTEQLLQLCDCNWFQVNRNNAKEKSRDKILNFIVSELSKFKLKQ